MLDFQHPDVEVIWNIFPLNIVVWSIFRVPLNILFFWLYLPLMWTWWLWNWVWENSTEVFVVFPIQSIWTIVNITLVLSSILIIPIPFMLLSVTGQNLFAIADW